MANTGNISHGGDSEAPADTPEITRVHQAVASRELGKVMSQLGMGFGSPKTSGRAPSETSADPMRAYMRQVETLPKMAREDEVDAGKRIERSQREVLATLLAAPFARELLAAGDDGPSPEQLERAIALLAGYERRLERAERELAEDRGHAREMDADRRELTRQRRRRAAIVRDVERSAGMSASDLRQTWLAVQRSDDEVARAKADLVRGHLRHVVYSARRYRGRGLPLADLVQEGNIGLMTAANKYDYRLGNRFATYANWWIRQAMIRALSIHGRTVRLPTHRTESLSQLNRARRQLAQSLRREPTIDELARELRVHRDQVEDLLVWARSVVSLEMPIGGDADARLSDLLADPGVELPSATAMTAELAEAAREHMSVLSPREREVLSLRFGIEDDRDLTLEQIGERFGVTRERVRQIEARALAKLRHPTRSRALRGFLDEDH
jgi:RNA polymerase primary sigma factor